MTKRVSVRFPPLVHDGLLDHKRVTDLNTNAFVVQAVRERLIREGFLRNPAPARRKAKQPA